MGLLARKHDTPTPAANEGLERLVEAARHREIVRTAPDAVSDLGIPVRTEAILALGERDADAGQEAVEAALRDPADRVRCAAVRVLYAREATGALVRALQWLPADKGQSRAMAVRAVLGLQDSVAPTALAHALIHGEGDELLNEVDEPLIQALVEDEFADVLIQRLVASLAEERIIVADRAGELLVRLAPDSVEALVAELRTGPAAAEAAYVLGRIADPRTVEALVEGLGHADPRVRAESAAALAELRDPIAVEPLLRATHDPDHSVRMQAGQALDRLGTAAVIVGVAALLEPMVRDAVDSATAGVKGPTNGRARPARRQPRSSKSNGGPPTADPPASKKRPAA